MLVTARKLNELEVVDTELAGPAAVEEAVRPLGAAELLVTAEQTRTVVALTASSEPVEPALELDRPEDYGVVPPKPASDDTGRAVG